MLESGRASFRSRGIAGADQPGGHHGRHGGAAVLAGRHALLGARLVVYRRVYGPDPGRHYLAVAGQSRNLRRPQPLPAGRQQRLGCDCRLAHHDRDRRHIARRGPRRQAFRLGSGARLGHRIGLCPARRFLCLGRLGASGQPSFRADRAHPERTRAQGDRHRPLRFCPPSRLHRRHRPCDRHRAGARLALGAGPGSGGHHPAGRPHAWRRGGAQGRAAGLRRIHAARALSLGAGLW